MWDAYCAVDRFPLFLPEGGVGGGRGGGGGLRDFNSLIVILILNLSRSFLVPAQVS